MGVDLSSNPLLNKGTAFTEDERDEFRLHGILPPNVGTLEAQVTRRLQVLRNFATDFERYAFLRNLQDNNETLSGWATRVPAAWASRSASSRCTPHARASIRRRPCRSRCRTHARGP